MNEKAFRKMGVAFVHNRAQTEPRENFAGIFRNMDEFLRVSYHGRNVDPPHHIGDYIEKENNYIKTCLI